MTLCNLTLQIRMSVGLEDTADIIEDLEQALKVKLIVCGCYLKALQCYRYYNFFFYVCGVLCRHLSKLAQFTVLLCLCNSL